MPKISFFYDKAHILDIFISRMNIYLAIVYGKGVYNLVHIHDCWQFKIKKEKYLKAK